MELLFPVVTVADFPTRLRCMACGRELRDGDPYSERWDSADVDDVVTELVCVYCATTDREVPALLMER